MGLKKNILYSGILTVSLYLLQFITFPYVSRVLGVEGLGLYNYYSGLVNFFLLSGAMGISVLGIREVAKVKDGEGLDRVFSSLLSLSLIYSAVSLAVYLGVSCFIAETPDDWKMVLTGAFYIVLNPFIVEWFYRGLENFKYITVRTLTIRILVVALVFVLVRTSGGALTYFILGLLTIALNACVNWLYSRKFATFSRPRLGDLKDFVRPSLVLGVYLLVSTYYVTIFPFLLGTVEDNVEVGCYSTATKLVLIILLMYNAYTQAMVPRISALGSGRKDDAERLIGKSFSLLFLLCVPLVALMEVMTPDIIRIISGAGYEGAVLPMRIAVPVILVGGLNQIVTNQILIPFGRDRQVTRSFLCGVAAGTAVSLIFRSHGALAFASGWVVAELVILAMQWHAMKPVYRPEGLAGQFLAALAVSLPLFLLFLLNMALGNVWLRAFVDCAVALAYVHVMYAHVLKSADYRMLADVIMAKFHRR